MQMFVSLIVLVALMSPALGGQAGDSKSKAAQLQAADSQSLQDLRDLTARKTALATDSEDLEAMAKSLQGVEVDTALILDQKASQGIMEIDAAIWFVAMHDKMQCEPDREFARAALKNRLEFYAHLLDIGADQIGRYLSFTKLPAIAQSGARVRDELRGAKTKMDEIAGRL